MPVSVDDPYLLASFTSTTHSQRHSAISCTPEGESAHSHDGSQLLVVAVQGEGVQLFNTADQKCILAYSTPPGYSFAGSAQTLQKSNTLRNVYAVIAKGTDITAKEEGKVVWMWKDESSSTLSASSSADPDVDMEADVIVKPSSAAKSVQKFDRTIHQLFVSPLIPSHVVLANTDGSISLVTEDLKRVVNTKEAHATPVTKSSKKSTATHTTSNLLWATTFNTSGSWIPSSALARQVLIIMTVTESGSNQITVTLSYVNEEVRGFSTLGHVDIVAGAGASGFAFDVKSGQFSFLTTSGQLKIYDFEVSQGDHVISATETLALPLPGYASAQATTPAKALKKASKAVVESESKAQHVGTVAIGDNYLAVAGIHNNEGKPELTLTIWDIRYGTLQAKHVLPGSFIAQTTTTRLSILPDSLLAMTISTVQNTTVKSEIYLCPFYCEPMSLLGAMGRMRDTAPFLGQKGSVLTLDAHTATTTTLLAPSQLGGVVKARDFKGTDLEAQVNAAQNSEKKALASLSAESKTATVQEFEKVFFKHVEQQSAEALTEMMDRYGVDAEAAKNAVANAAEKKTEGTAQAMEIDNEAVKAGGSLSKKKKNAVKAAARAAKAGKSQESKDVEDASSSDSSSDEEEGDEEVIVLTSDEEHEEEDEEEEEEQEYELNEEQERARMEAYLSAVDEWRKTEQEAIKNYKIQRRQLRAGRKAAPLPELSHHFVSTVVGRCFTRLPNDQPDMSFWPEKVIRYLIENQLVGNSNPGAGQAGIALELMEREQWNLLELALKKLYDIPEMDMVMMLKQVIGFNKNKSSVKATDSKASHTTASSVPDIPHFLNLIMSAPKNEIFMLQAIKRLSVEELSIILEILKGWIGIWDERGGIGHQNQQPDKKQLPGGLPGYALMIDFTTMILDVHFPSLILSPHLHPVLKAIQASIQHETEVANQLEQCLRGPLGLFDRKHREMVRRKKEASAPGGAALAALNGTVVTAAGGVAPDKRRRRRWEGGEGIPDYAVEIIHL